MPPYGIWPLAIIGLIPTIIAQFRIMPAKLSSLASAVSIGLVITLYIMNAFLEMNLAAWYMKFLPLIFAVMIFLTDLGTRKFQEKTGYRWFVLTGSFGWVGVEMIRSFIPVMGTWGFIAYAYFKQPWLIQPVSIFGIFGLSLLNMLAGFALGKFTLAWIDQRWKFDEEAHTVDFTEAVKWLKGTAFAFAAWIGLSLVLLFVPAEKTTLKVASIQPGFRTLWTEQEHVSNTLSNARYNELYGQLYQNLLTQTEALADQDLDIIVWPEGALNIDPQQLFTKTLKGLAAKTNAYLTIPYGVGFRNEVTVLSPEGDFLGVYGKDHPVVFVNEQSETRGTYPTYTTEFGEIGTIICYDLDFTDTARKIANNGAQLILVPSGDWPGIADKHYAHLVFRAVENRVAMIKSDRSYDSAIIDPYGRIIDSYVSKAPAVATLVADVDIINGNPIQRYLGDWIGWIALAGMVFFSVPNPLIKSRK
jgi:apolipoprotein N-acyltransferase